MSDTRNYRAVIEGWRRDEQGRRDALRQEIRAQIEEERRQAENLYIKFQTPRKSISPLNIAADRLQTSLDKECSRTFFAKIALKILRCAYNACEQPDTRENFDRARSAAGRFGPLAAQLEESHPNLAKKIRTYAIRVQERCSSQLDSRDYDSNDQRTYVAAIRHAGAAADNEWTLERNQQKLLRIQQQLQDYSNNRRKIFIERTLETSHSHALALMNTSSSKVPSRMLDAFKVQLRSCVDNVLGTLRDDLEDLDEDSVPSEKRCLQVVLRKIRQARRTLVQEFTDIAERSFVGQFKRDLIQRIERQAKCYFQERKLQQELSRLQKNINGCEKQLECAVLKQERLQRAEYRVMQIDQERIQKLSRRLQDDGLGKLHADRLSGNIGQLKQDILEVRRWQTCKMERHNEEMKSVLRTHLEEAREIMYEQIKELEATSRMQNGPDVSAELARLEHYWGRIGTASTLGGQVAVFEQWYEETEHPRLGEILRGIQEKNVSELEILQVSLQEKFGQRPDIKIAEACQKLAKQVERRQKDLHDGVLNCYDHFESTLERVVYDIKQVMMNQCSSEADLEIRGNIRQPGWWLYGLRDDDNEIVGGP